MDLELISFKICPFAQRAVITLKHKQTPFRNTFIEMGDTPAWFKQISPFGQVPLLRVDGQQVLFESAVIDEFLDEITPGQLLPEDPLTRAVDRSWIEFGSACMLDLSGMMHAQDADAFEGKQEKVKEKLHWLEDVLGDGPYFNGAKLSLVDFAYAPFFMRAELLNIQAQLYPEKECPKLKAWHKTLMALPVVQESVVAGFPDILRQHIRNKAPYAAERFGF